MNHLFRKALCYPARLTQSTCSLIVILMLCYGCVPTPRLLLSWPKVESIVVVDYTKYSDQGFLFTPYEFSGSYEAVGPIHFSFKPKVQMVAETVKTGRNRRPKLHYRVEEEAIDTEVMLREIYLKTKAMGANAIVSFKWVLSYKKRYLREYPPEWPKHHGYELTASGFAIRRLNTKQ